MRLKIPYPIQSWFNTINGASRKPQFQANEEVEKSLHKNSPVDFVTDPAVVGAIQQLYYEIFALPVQTSEAIDVAQTICGHIYEFALSVHHPGVQLVVLDLIPTLIHAYLVITTTFTTGGIHRDYTRGGFIGLGQRDSIFKQPSNNEDTRVHTSLHRMSIGLKGPPFNNNNQRGFSLRTFKQWTSHNLLPSNSSNSAITVAPATGSPVLTENAMRHEIKRTNNRAVLTAVLEALLVGLYNVYVAGKILPPRLEAPQPIVTTGGATIFSNRPVVMNGGKHVRLLTMETKLLQDETGNCQATRTNKCFYASQVDEVNTFNRWQILGALLRLSTDRCCDLSERGREAMCCLALLMGPTGLHTYRLPACLLVDGSCTIDTSKTRGWRRRFSRRTHRNVPKPQQEVYRKFPNHLDITSITAPLKSVSTALQRTSKEAMTADVKLRSGASSSLNATFHNVVLAQVDMTLANHVGDRDEDGLDFGVGVVDDNDGGLDVSTVSTEELGSSASLYSEECDSERDLKRRQQQKPHKCPRLSGVESNTSNTLKELPPIEDQEQEEAFENASSRQAHVGDEDEDDAPVTANSQESSSSVSLARGPHVFLSPTLMLPPSPLNSRPNTKSKEHKPKTRWTVKAIKMSAANPKRASMHVAKRIPHLSPNLIIDLLPGLQFLLSTPQATLAAAAITSLSVRANMELWPSVIIYLNSICNSKLFLEATSANHALDPAHLLHHQTNQSNKQNTHRSAKRFRLFPNNHSHVNTLQSSSEDEHSVPAESGQRPPIKATITNASFHAIRFAEDIPIIGEAKMGASIIFATSRTTKRSQSYRYSRTTEALKPSIFPYVHSRSVQDIPKIEPLINRDDIRIEEDGLSLKFFGSRIGKNEPPSSIIATHNGIVCQRTRNLSL